MSSRRWIAWAGSAGLLIGLLAAWSSTSPAQLPAARPVVAWEYLMAGGTHNSEVKDLLNAYGAQGWELVSAVNRDPNNSVTYIFKRRKP